MLKINSQKIYEDDPRDMTVGRRLSRYLSSKFTWYNVASKLEPVDRVIAGSEGVQVKRVSPPNLDLAWEFFEHQMLPRRLATDNSFRAIPDISYERVEPGEMQERSKLYPIWNTPLRDMGDFGREYFPCHLKSNSKVRCLMPSICKQLVLVRIK